MHTTFQMFKVRNILNNYLTFIQQACIKLITLVTVKTFTFLQKII